MAAAAVLLAGMLCAAPAPDKAQKQAEPEAKKKQDWRLAPDGVRYANRQTYELMQMKALSGNLLKNPSFEQGRYWPYNWEPTDRLGTLWIKGGTNGKRCLRIFNNILEGQWLSWNRKVFELVKQAEQKTGGRPQSLPANPVPAPPDRLPTKPPYLDTVAANHGIHYRSDYVRIRPGAIYRFSVDARSDPKGAPMVFIKGFFDQKRKTEQGEVVLKRNAYRAPMTLHGCGKQWQRFARVFHPERSNCRYAIVPVAKYDFDNLRLEIVGHEPIRRQPEAEPEKKEKTPKPELREDEFPVFK